METAKCSEVWVCSILTTPSIIPYAFKKPADLSYSKKKWGIALKPVEKNPMLIFLEHGKLLWVASIAFLYGFKA